MSRAKAARRASGLVALLSLPALAIFGCSTIIGLGDYSVAGSSAGHANGNAGESTSSAGEAGQAGEPSNSGGGVNNSGGGGNNGGAAGTGATNDSAGAGGEGNAPAVVGCDGATSFVPNPDIVRSCLLRTGCDPTFDPIRTISTCVTLNTQAALPGESCNLTSKDCSGYQDCEHVGVAGDDLCGGGKQTRCENGKAINCSNYMSGDRFADCTALGAGCGTYTYTNGLVYADCEVDLGSTDSCQGQPNSDSEAFCHSAPGEGDSTYYCWDEQAYGATCSPFAMCTDEATDGGDARCFFNLTKCSTPVTPTCNGNVATECSEGGLLKYDCGSVGLTCNISDGREYCLAPGCTADDVNSSCSESCSDDGTQLTFCYGGAPYTVSCADYGFTQCRSDTMTDGTPFAACRF